ncbi:MAG: hypothetical protein RBT41_08830 [Clostridia bacterium]|jgi:ClpP class serine protease|nr:hypothetical protein [Clostridia bacterium]
MDWSSLFFIFLIFSSLLPMFNQRRIEANRIGLIRAIEKKRGSRVITMIHRQESLSFLGLAFSRHINIEDSEHILRAIRLTPDSMPLDIILHTPGGLVLASEQIAYALQRHPAKVTVLVPHYAMSGGTMLALAADEILMDENAVLGPVDPQIGQFPAVSIIKVTKEKDINEIDDNTLILADVSQKAIRQVENTIYNLLVDEMPEDKARDIARAFSEGLWTHDYPIKVDELKNMGIPVEAGLPEEVYRLMELYPQAGGRRPSVQYIPLPYEVPHKNQESK